jgi:hypothetical protein
MAHIDINEQTDIHGFTPDDRGEALFGPNAPGVAAGDLLEATSAPHSGTWVVTEVEDGDRDGVTGKRVRAASSAGGASSGAAERAAA